MLGKSNQIQVNNRKLTSLGANKLMVGYGAGSNVIALWGPGGAGKTDLALNLTAALSRYGQRTACYIGLDTAVRASGAYYLTRHMGIRKEAIRHNLSTLCRGELTLEAILSEMMRIGFTGDEILNNDPGALNEAVRTSGGKAWWFLPGVPSATELPIIQPYMIMQIIDELSTLFDHIIIDLGPLLDDIVIAALDRASRIATILRQDVSLLENWRDILTTDIVAASGGHIETSKVGYILNFATETLWPTPTDVVTIMQGFSEIGRIPDETRYLNRLRQAQADELSPWVLVDEPKNNLRIALLRVMQALVPELNQIESAGIIRKRTLAGMFARQQQ